jgi:DNA-directed RNA polymerase specialized sigma24 family protein
MQKRWDITQEAFDKFLAWLDGDRERAGAKYEVIRRKLIRIFTCRGCQVSEDLADETINRVIRKVPEMSDTYIGDPLLYFYGVARRVYLEHLRNSPAPLPPPPLDSPEQKEKQDECLEKCMKALTMDNRNLVLEYYKEDGSPKIKHRKALAATLGIGGNALRIRAHRIRARLQSCVESCLQKEG